MLSVAYRGVSIPLFWTVTGEKGCSDNKERREILQKFIDEKDIISCITNPYAARSIGNTLQFLNNLVKVTSPSGYAGEITFGDAKLQLPGQIYVVPHLAIPIYIQNYEGSNGSYLFRMRDFFIPKKELVFTGNGKKGEITIKFE